MLHSDDLMKNDAQLDALHKGLNNVASEVVAAAGQILPSATNSTRTGRFELAELILDPHLRTSRSLTHDIVCPNASFVRPVDSGSPPTSITFACSCKGPISHDGKMDYECIP